MKASLAVHTFNEGPAVLRLILSSLHAAAHFNEWVVLDHRSNDDTQTLLDHVEPLLHAYGINLVRLFESRDLSPKLTFADVRGRTVQACSNPVVALMDSDFILGTAFLRVLADSIPRLGRHTRAAAIAYPVPVVWDALSTDHNGRISEHGRVWVHGAKARILHRDRITYRQAGKWEKTVFTDTQRKRIVNVGNDGSVLISANVKSSERLKLRRTMTMYMEDAMSGKTRGEWLEDYEAGATRDMPEYRYRPVNLVGKRLNLANLELP